MPAGGCATLSIMHHTVSVDTRSATGAVCAPLVSPKLHERHPPSNDMALTTAMEGKLARCIKPANQQTIIIIIVIVIEASSRIAQDRRIDSNCVSLRDLIHGKLQGKFCLIRGSCFGGFLRSILSTITILLPVLFCLTLHCIACCFSRRCCCCCFFLGSCF